MMNCGRRRGYIFVVGDCSIDSYMCRRRFVADTLMDFVCVCMYVCMYVCMCVFACVYAAICVVCVCVCV